MLAAFTASPSRVCAPVLSDKTWGEEDGAALSRSTSAGSWSPASADSSGTAPVRLTSPHMGWGISAAAAVSTAPPPQQSVLAWQPKGIRPHAAESSAEPPGLLRGDPPGLLRGAAQPFRGEFKKFAVGMGMSAEELLSDRSGGAALAASVGLAALPEDSEDEERPVSEAREPESARGGASRLCLATQLLPSTSPPPHVVSPAPQTEQLVHPFMVGLPAAVCQPLGVPSLPALGLAATVPTPAERQPVVTQMPMQTLGSTGHLQGTCKPCAFVHTRGCENGAACPFCHLCDAGEKQRRRKEKRAYHAARGSR